MNDTICYLNTDLDLASPADLTRLVSALQAAGLLPLHCAQREDGLWHATCETVEQFTEPEPNIAAIVGIIDALPDELRAAWSACTVRELNIGFDCGAKPWAFNQALSTEVLARIASVGASLRVTLYPPDPEQAK